MALAILDGTQTATTLSTILSSGQHITAHTVVSLGTQAITDMRGAVSGSVVSVSSLPAISGTVTANAGDNFLSSIAGGILSFQDNDGFQISSLPAISGTVDITALPYGTNSIGSVTVGGGFMSLTTGTSRIGVVTVGNSVTIGAGTVTIGAGTAQIGSVTASISGTVPISISSVTVGNSVTIGSLPAISGTVTANVFGKDANSSATPQIPVISYDEGIATATLGYVVPVQVTNVGGQISEANPLPIYGTVTANTFAVQGTAVTTSNFTSTTASTVLANYNATREVLTIFNEGAGNLHISPGATCTTIAYQVRLSSGDYYEVPNHQTTITHSAVFATAGTARICQLS